MMKRFNVPAITRDREYNITKGTPKSRILYFTANPNGEAEVVTVFLRANARLKKLKLDVDFSELSIRGRGAGGNLVSKNAIRKIEMSEEGVSTLGARKVWYDETVRTLNAEGRGRLLGEFMADDRIVVFLSSGEYAFTGFDLNTRFDDKMIHLEKWHPQRPVSVVYYEGEKEDWYVKRFHPELVQKPFSFIGDHESSRLGVVSTAHHPLVRIRYNRRFKETRDREDEVFDASEFITIKGIRALGNKLSGLPVTEVQLEPLDDEKEAQTQAVWEAQFASNMEAPTAPREPAPEAMPADAAGLEQPKSDANTQPAEPKTSTSSADDDAESPSNGGGIQPTLF